MRITFLLPGHALNPGGGFKVVYEYANGLVERGHDVTVVHTCDATRSLPMTSSARNLLKYFAYGLGYRGGYKPTKWFNLLASVRLSWVPSLSSRWIPDSDAVIATAWQTAEWVAGYPESKGAKYYLIQHKESVFEDTDEDRVMQTWRLPLKKIVIAGWLEEICRTMGEDCTVIPNGLDFTTFGLDVPIEERCSHQVAMLYHDYYEWKGSAEGISALSIVRKEIPTLHVSLFGVGSGPKDLPDWCTYHRNPSRIQLRSLYNNAAIFITPSWSEGCAAPPAEAMQCGAAVCATDIGGHREYAINCKTALLSPVRNIEALAKNVRTLVEDTALRRSLAQNGWKHVQQYTWDRAVISLEKLLLEGQPK